jgi:hypothetical protein
MVLEVSICGLWKVLEKLYEPRYSFSDAVCWILCTLSSGASDPFADIVSCREGSPDCHVVVSIFINTSSLSSSYNLGLFFRLTICYTTLYWCAYARSTCPIGGNCRILFLFHRPQLLSSVLLENSLDRVAMPTNSVNLVSRIAQSIVLKY